MEKIKTYRYEGKQRQEFVYVKNYNSSQGFIYHVLRNKKGVEMHFGDKTFKKSFRLID